MQKDKHDLNKFLCGHTIYLRTIELADVTNGVWHNWFNDYDLTTNNSHGIYPINTDDQIESYNRTRQDKANISMAICSLKDDEVIGTASIQKIDLINRKAEIACMIGKNLTPTAGLESIGLLTEHCMDRLNLNKVHGGAHGGLKEWVKMLECLGFQQEGISKEEFLSNQKWYDLIRFGVLAKEFLDIRQKRNGQYLCESAGKLYKEAVSKLKID